MQSRGRLAVLLKKLRLDAELSLRDVESVTAISNAYLSQLENGRTKNPSPHVLKKLARAYSVRYEMLMDAAGYSQTAPTNGVLRVAMLIGQLDASEQDEVSEFISHLVARRSRKLS